MEERQQMHQEKRTENKRKGREDLPKQTEKTTEKSLKISQIQEMR